MSFKARLDRIEQILKETGYDQNHPHVALAREIKGELYNEDGTEFVSNHPEDCPQQFIVITSGEERREVPAR